MTATRQRWGHDPGKKGAAADRNASAAATEEMNERERQRKEEEMVRRAQGEAARKERIRELLTSRERSAITHALRLCAERFDEDAKTAKEANFPGLVLQFESQAKDSRDVVEWMED